MRIVVIGCGLAGLTTAYYLRREGAEVTVVDRATAPARETSYANGSMITPSLADPWNAPGVLGKLFSSLGKDDSPMLLRASALPSLIGWGMRFVRNSRPARYQESFLANVRFARYSQEVMQDLQQQHVMEFQYRADGTIQLFRDARSLSHGRKVASWLRQATIDHTVLGRDELLELEPALAPVGDDFSGAIHFPADEVGNARLFCEALAQLAAADGVEFRFSDLVRGVARSRGRIVSVNTAREKLVADAFVLAAGSYSWPLAREFGIRLAVRPVKGYSITIPLKAATPTAAALRPHFAVVDDALHAAVVPLGGDRLRVAGTAEFAGFDTSLRPSRVANLHSLLQQIYPELQYPQAEVEAWCGLRPMTPDGRPIVGRSKIDNLFLNTGHGPLGWTMACGSGRALAELIVNGSSAYDLGPFRPARF